MLLYKYNNFKMLYGIIMSKISFAIIVFLLIGFQNLYNIIINITCQILTFFFEKIPLDHIAVEPSKNLSLEK